MQTLTFLKIACTMVMITLLGACASTDQATDSVDIELIQPNNLPKPTVMVLHGCDGQRSKSWHSQARIYSDWGYNVVMVDSFTRRGYSNVCSDGHKVHPRLRALDVQQAVDYINRQSWHRGGIVVVGYSHGGAVALNVAANPDVTGITAVVAFYPHCGTYFIGQNYWYNRVPVTIHIGDRDTWTPPGICMRESWTGVAYQFNVYANSYHGFDRGGEPRTYMGHYLELNSAATELAYSRVREFLARELSK